ncbi:Lar family restriction alleviation protein [Comamonas sp. C24C]
MKTTEHKLKRCPFCGCNAHFEKDELQWEWVACVSCGMQGNRRASCMDDCKPLLAEEWNRRARPEIQPLDTSKVVSDDELAKAFAGTNFGSADQLPATGRYVINQGDQYFGGATHEPRELFQEIWESTGDDWATNPWVWVIDFKRIEKPG